MKLIDRGRALVGRLRTSFRSGDDVGAFVAAEYSPAATREDSQDRIRTLGTFGGVFTPSFLTIIGVIMYLRFSWIVSNAGLYGTLLIVVLANVITFITALSVSSIASNERMETGGAYFMVNRVLGFLPGGAIGIPLYLSQALSIALYLIGFAETVVPLVPGWNTLAVALVTLLLLALFGLIGARFMVRVQYLILILILLSFVSIASGFLPLHANLAPGYLPGLGFWSVFAVFFPAVTGILAGVSMSGDLKDPAKSIPRGTLAAVAAGFFVYLLVPVMLAFSVEREALLASDALTRASRWPLFVTAGIFGATLSSAIGSLLAAPRTLQALGRDGVLPRFLGGGVGKTAEPVAGLLVSCAVAAGAILLGSLNAVAEVLTMFFLTTYGMLNFSAGMERLVGNPSYRPSIGIPWWISFLGAAGCFAVMFLINTVATLVALALILFIFFSLSIRSAELQPAAGGVWEGFWTSLFFAVSRRLVRSRRRGRGGKNWRPIIQLFASDVASHAAMISLGAYLTRRAGALAVYAFHDGSNPDRREAIAGELSSFGETLDQHNIFTTIVGAESTVDGMLVAAQAAEFAGASYNSVMLGLPSAGRQDREFSRLLQGLSALDRNILLFRRGAIPWNLRSDPILVWWGGKEQNVRLMLLLAHLLSTSPGGKRQIRLGTIVNREEDRATAEERLAAACREQRIAAAIFVVTNTTEAPVRDILADHSRDACLVLLGMAKPEGTSAVHYLPALRATAAGLENVLFVLSNIASQEYE